MRIAILVNQEKDPTLAFTSSLVKYLLAKKQDALVEEEISKFIKDVSYINKENIHSIDFAIVLGGDGTILLYAHKYSEYNFPILGINLGRVGCLTEGTPENVFDTIDKVLNNESIIEERVVLEGKFISNKSVKKFTAYNEISLTRGTQLKMLNINIKVNQNNNTSFYADGVIVATPTGSSAYSLSCGGPLLTPTSKSFVITPVSAQCRNITSLVISSQDKIAISLNSKKNEQNINNFHAQLAIDGKESIQMTYGDTIQLRCSKKKLRIIKVNLNSSLYEPIFKVTKSLK